MNGIGEMHTFVVDVDKDLGDGAGFVAAAEGDVDVTLTDSAGAVNGVDTAASTCDDAGDNLDAELDEAEELDTGDPVELACDYAALYGRLPGLAVVGGCCGTDHRHVEASATAILGLLSTNR